MADTNNLSRNWALGGIIVAACGLLGATLGWISASTSQGNSDIAALSKNQKQDPAFVLPPPPPPIAEKVEQTEKTEKSDKPDDTTSLRIWELSARQPLPPRKEPLTPPNWKIVGVSTIGKDKNVIILFDNQTTGEILKVGDKLPGGAKIVDIFSDRLRLILNGQPMTLSLSEQ
ncbi:MAG: hypothetical protein HYS18_10340 [Burkholderiales bacterium]|nr:hypothetical protein [Burkholderiales bacterium]